MASQELRTLQMTEPIHSRRDEAVRQQEWRLAPGLKFIKRLQFVCLAELIC
jgi:hypothetical protein